MLLAQTADAICGVFLMHHDPAQPLKANVRKRDASVVADDSVELFITHTNAPRPYYHFIFNTVNADMNIIAFFAEQLYIGHSITNTYFHN